MRIAIGQLWQETNTFNPLSTTRQDFEDFGVVRGQEIIERFHDTNELGGFIQSLRRWPERPEIVGLARLPAWPSGRATEDTFLWLRDELEGALHRALPVDAVLLALHGAMVADAFPDVEGEILSAFRDVVGPRTPLVATLDLHANVTRRMVRAADALVLYHTAPHIDVFETGQRGAALLRKMLVDGARPVTAFQKIPAVVPAERANTEDPASVSHALKARLTALEAQPGVLAAGLATVQPWLDIPELGTAVVVVTDGDANRAGTECAALADEFWPRRRSTINGIVYRNFFDSFNDPAKFGLFYQAALLLRRGDVQAGKEMTALRVANEEGWELKGVGDLPGLNVLPEVHRMGIALPGEEVAADKILPAEKSSVDTEAGEILSDTGELYRNWVKRFGWIDTPRSKVAYGFLGEQGKIGMKGLELEVRTDYAVVALGSLTDQPLEDSPSILLTAVGRCQNSGVEFSEDGSRMLHPGKHPMLIEPIEATIRLRTHRADLKVFVISEHGELVCRLPVEYGNGVLSFQIGEQPEYHPSTMYYLIRI